jgi:hypothetical protein
MTTPQLRQELADSPYEVEGAESMDRATLIKAVKAAREYQAQTPEQAPEETALKTKESPDAIQPIPARQPAPTEPRSEPSPRDQGQEEEARPGGQLPPPEQGKNGNGDEQAVRGDAQRPELLKPRPMNMAGEVRPERPQPAARPPLPQKSIDLMDKAITEKDTASLAQMVDPKNKGWRAQFTDRTGIDLPKGLGASVSAVKAWASKPEVTAESPPLRGMGAADPTFEGGAMQDAVHEKMARAVGAVPLAEDVNPGIAERFRNAKMSIQEFGRYLGNRTLPTMASKSKDAAGAVAQMANYPAIAARNAAELKSKILGGAKQTDPDAALAGKVLVEANLRGIRDGYLEQAAKAEGEGDTQARDAAMRNAERAKTTVGPGGAFEDEDAFQKAGQSPAVQAYIQRFRDIVNPKMDENYRASRGWSPDTELQSRGDKDYGTRINLMALPEDSVDPAKGIVGTVGSGRAPGSASGTIISKNQFAKQATGGGAAYASGLGDIIDNSMLKSTKAALERKAHDVLQQEGLGFYDSQGGQRKIDGHTWYPHRIENIPANDPGAYFLTRDDITPEYNRARNATKPEDLGFVGGALKAPVAASVFGPMEPKAHIGNMLGFMASAPFRGQTVLEKVAEAVAARNAIPGVSTVANLTGRLMASARGITDWAKQTPEALSDARKLAEGGAWKESDAITTAKWANPLSWGNNVITSVSSGMRIAGSRIYDELIKEGAPDTPIDRGNFVNKFMGQYNEKLQGSVIRALRSSGIQPFAVPLKTAQQVAMDALTLDPGFKAATAAQRAKLGMEVAASIAGPIVGVAAANVATSGQPWGRSGVPFGAIDLGKDDDKGKPQYTDALLTVSGVRKIMQTTGVDAFLRKWKDTGFDSTMKGGLGQSGTAMATQQGDRVLRFLTGPGVTAGYEAATGKSPTIESQRISPVVPDGPGLNQLGANLKGMSQHTLLTLGLVAPPEESQDRSFMQRLLPSVTPQSGKAPERAEATTKIQAAVDLKSLLEDLPRQARGLSAEQRVPYLHRQIDAFLASHPNDRPPSEYRMRGLIRQVMRPESSERSPAVSAP